MLRQVILSSRRSAAVAVVLVLAAACSSGTGEPTEFSDRVALPSCGAVDARDGVDGDEQAAIDCLTEAQASARSGELVLRLNGTEGELLVRYMRVLDDGSGEAFYDNRRDPRTSDKWALQAGCRSVAPAPIELVAVRDCETSTPLG